MRKFSFRDLCSASDVLELELEVVVLEVVMVVEVVDMMVGVWLLGLEVEEDVGGCEVDGCVEVGG